jgi:hypothetical protein
VEEWYVAQHERKSRFARLAEIAAEKLAARKEKRAEDEGA